jgi:hypothetical protein
MGEVTPFRNKSRARAGSAPPEGAAKILFFLGVRYERQEDGRDGEDGLNGKFSADGGGRRSGGTRARRKKRA